MTFEGQSETQAVKQSDTSSRVIHMESELPESSRLVRSAVIRFLKSDEKSLVDKDDPLHESFKVAESIMDFLQIDTHGELQYKHRFILDKPKMFSKRYGDAKSIIDHFVITSKRDVLFLLVSNCFNRADELAETALNSTKSANIGSDLGVSFLSKARIAEYKDSDGKPVRVTFNEAIEHIQKLADYWGVEGISWQKTTQEIVEAQLRGMDLLKKMKTGSQYSVQEALQYRKDTIGKYGLMLGEIAFGVGDQRAKKLQRELLDTQVTDDVSDVEEDIKSQVNPFVALLNSFGLAQDYIDFLTVQRNEGKLDGIREEDRLAFFVATLPKDVSYRFNAAWVITAREYFELD